MIHTPRLRKSRDSCRMISVARREGRLVAPWLTMVCRAGGQEVRFLEQRGLFEDGVHPNVRKDAPPQNRNCLMRKVAVLIPQDSAAAAVEG
ncbi:hypothetical protein N7492_002737 [Penicillium capsulatum]|uniref:Uncharacterized protein n=1 Tax=Penicillium capsulatum TaxID=69766 RepID=A0A9W9LWQ4_9EURO|nr:hypothetical protein N7492_002737 [Penicillium capsulatum]KAJ6122666.1 hypothetical protein N7512_005131 [Penicillium capsulatum]